MSGGEEINTGEREDARAEAAVLQQLLALHPAQLTLAELRRAVAGEASGFAPRDAVERAVRELTAAGLVRRNGELVIPSRAALRCDELLG